MKILVIGLDGGTSELLFSDERLENLRRLMEYGCYGKLTFQVNLDRLGLWMSLGTGQNLGPLGELGPEELDAITEKAIWKLIEEQNKNVFVVGLPPFNSYLDEIQGRIDDSLLDMRSQGEKLTLNDLDLLKVHIYSMSREQLDRIRSLMQSEEWNYFQFVDDGLYQLQQGEQNPSESSDQYQLADYYLHLDDGIGKFLELLDDNTIVLVVSINATRSFDGSFILASANNPLSGEIEGTNLLDIAPTLLELSGYAVPAQMQGKSLVAGKMSETGSDMDLSAEEEEILREQLSGLGYL